DLTGTATDALGQRGRIGRGLYGAYFNGVPFNDTIVHHVDEQVNLSVPAGGRPSPSLSPDTWSVRWEGRVYAPSTGTYTFHAPADDRMRLWVSKFSTPPIIDAASSSEASGSIYLTEGLHALKMELEQDTGTGGTALSWTPPGGTKEAVPASHLYPLGNGQSSTVFDNVDFTGWRYTRPTFRIDFDWATNSPDPRISVDTWSYRTTGYVEPRYTEDYTFSTVADDHAKLWIQDQLVIDDVTDGANEQASSPIRLEAGKRYKFRLDFVEKTGNASLRWHWQSARQAKELVPQAQTKPVNAGPVVVRADRSAPTDVQVSGPLAELDAANRVISGSTGVRVTAKDGTAAAPRSGMASAEIEVGGTPRGTKFAQPCATESCPLDTTLTLDPAGLAHGMHQVRVATADQLGHVTRSPALDVAVDKEGPELTVSGPARDASGGWLPLSATVGVHARDGDATLPGHGVQSVRLLVDGVEHASASPACTTTCEWSGDMSVVGLPSGSRTLSVVATDAGGHTSTESWDVEVDATSPSIALSGALERLDGRWVAGGTHGLSITASDAGTGVVRLQARVDGVVDFDAISECAAGGCTVARDWSLDADSLAPGHHLVQIDAYDGGGMWVSKWLTIEVDRQAPEIATPTGPLWDRRDRPGDEASEGLSEGSHSVTLRATDEDPPSAAAGVRAIDVQVTDEDGAVVAESQDAAPQACADGACDKTRTFTLDAGGLAEGRYTVAVTAVDQAGNASPPTEWEVTVDRSPPSIAFETLPPASSPWISREDKIVLRGSDPRTGGEGTATRVSMSVAGAAVPPARETCDATSCIDEWRPALVAADVVPDGRYSVTFTAADRLGNTRTVVETLAVDRTSPSVSTTGTLAAAGAAGTEISGDHDVTVSATDGDLFHPAAGVERIELLADSRIVSSSDVDCIGVSCSRTVTLTLAAADYAGAEVVGVRVTDGAGNARARLWPVEGGPVASGCGPAATTTSGSSDDVSIATAYERTRDVHAAAVGGAEEAAPALAEGDDDLVVTGTDVPATVGNRAEEGFAVETEAGDLCVEPVAVDDEATDAALVGNNSAAIYANTNDSTDLTVRAADEGIETFQTLRSADAPETFTWQMDLAGAEELALTGEDEVTVFDSDPQLESPTPKPATPPLPDDAALDALQEQGQVAPSAVLPDPDADAAANAGAQNAGIIAAPDGEVTPEQLPDAPPEPEPASGPPTDPAVYADALEDEAEAIDTATRAAALEDLATARSAAAADTAVETAEDEQHRASAADAPVPVATVTAPWAKDRDGDPVEVDLDVAGDRVTMSVEHRDDPAVDY
nr:PA14 domain-containing protein [Actinomycetota bacterium]